MGISVTIKYEGLMEELIKRNYLFKKISNNNFEKQERRKWDRGNYSTYDLQVIFIGKTGYGKSTTINSIIGKEIFETDYNEPCTKVCQSAEFKFDYDSKCYFSLGDLPGIGESIENDTEYLDMYSNFLKKTDTVVYVLRADSRDYSVDEEVFNNLLNQRRIRNKVIVGLNFVDKIEPVNRKLPFKPTSKQLKNIERKKAELSDMFNIKIERIIPYSATANWNLNKLVKKIVNKTLEEM